MRPGTERAMETARVILALPVVQIFALPVAQIWNLAIYANAANPRWPMKVMMFLVFTPTLLFPCSLWLASLACCVSGFARGRIELTNHRVLACVRCLGCLRAALLGRRAGWVLSTLHCHNFGRRAVCAATGGEIAAVEADIGLQRMLGYFRYFSDEIAIKRRK